MKACSVIHAKSAKGLGSRDDKSVLVQDVKALTALARKRCSDDKAGVRKAAAQLLEGLLLLRASGAGGAAVVLPSPADIAVVQAAAADSLASSPHSPSAHTAILSTTSSCLS